MKTRIRSGKSIFWGIVLIAAAVLIVLDAVGIAAELPLIKLALGVLCVAWGIREIIRLNFAGTVFPAAFIFMLFESEIGNCFGAGENIISNWLVLIVALLLTVGIHLIFGDLKFRRRGGHYVYTDDGGHIKTKSSKNFMSGKSHYIDCASFSHEVLENSFGAYEVYFQNTDSFDGGVLKVSNNFGAVEIYVPSDWNVINNVKCVFGAAEVNGKGNPAGKRLTVVGDSTFGAVEINYQK